MKNQIHDINTAVLDLFNKMVVFPVTVLLNDDFIDSNLSASILRGTKLPDIKINITFAAIF